MKHQRRTIINFFIISSLFLIVNSNLFAKDQSAWNPKLLTSRYASWGIEPNKRYSIHLSGAWKKFKKRKDIIVAVIDTGIDPDQKFLENNIYTENGKGNTFNFGKDFSQGKMNRATPMDNHGHGTHVSGIIKSIFPDVKIIALKYYNPKASGQDNLDSTILALQYAVDMNVDVINYSGGGPESSDRERAILKEAEQKGILVIAAAGNEESNIDLKQFSYFPASYGFSNIISVAAYNQNLRILPSSNYGKKSVDIAAPGYRIKSSLPYNRAGYLTGTSQATAFVTGMVAMIKSMFPKLNFREIKNIIVKSAKKELTLMGKCRSNGRLDATAALNLANQMYEDKYQLKNKPIRRRKIATRYRNNQTKKSSKIVIRK